MIICWFFGKFKEFEGDFVLENIVFSFEGDLGYIKIFWVNLYLGC